jgi:FtsZ-interacting cell division protein ZipA
MSELQAALLAIGFGAIVTIYGFGWWQQRRYRGRFDKVFKESHADALYKQGDTSLGLTQQSPAVEPNAINAQIQAQSEDALASAKLSPANLLDGSCALINARSDFIIELHTAEPCPAALLDGLWQRKFDFRKLVQVCGWSLSTKKWERVIADSQIHYTRFRIALQLVDRGGVISEAKLADFRDLVIGIAQHNHADTTVPDIHETYHHAVELDTFCAQVDQMVGVNLVPPGERSLPVTGIAQAAGLQGMILEADGAFHLLSAQGNSLFSLINQNNEPFQHHTLETSNTPGITLLLDVPRVENPGLQFDRLIHVANALASDLQANLVDDHQVVLSDNSLALIRTQITVVEEKMNAQGIPPGSAQARRLFS